MNSSNPDINLKIYKANKEFTYVYLLARDIKLLINSLPIVLYQFRMSPIWKYTMNENTLGHRKFSPGYMTSQDYIY